MLLESLNFFLLQCPCFAPNHPQINTHNQLNTKTTNFRWFGKSPTPRVANLYLEDLQSLTQPHCMLTQSHNRSNLCVSSEYQNTWVFIGKEAHVYSHAGEENSPSMELFRSISQAPFCQTVAGGYLELIL